jgi:hypothetical protein
LEIPDIHTSNKTGYHVGAYSLFKIVNWSSARVYFFSAGNKVDLGDWDAKYINIPVMLKLYLAGGFNLQAGPPSWFFK